jgi:Nitrogen permease regulator 2
VTEAHAAIMEAQAGLIITKPALCGRVITLRSVSAPGYYWAEGESAEVSEGKEGNTKVEGGNPEDASPGPPAAEESEKTAPLSAGATARRRRGPPEGQGEQQQLRVVGFPVRLDGDKYPRNFLQFNLCFVFPESVDTTPFERVVSTLGRLLETLEVESEFLSTPRTHALLDGILFELFEQLRSTGTCNVRIDDANTIRLRLLPGVHHRNPAQDTSPALRAWDVPVFVRKNVSSSSWQNADLAVQQVVPFIDGVRPLAEIARKSGVYIGIVAECVKLLCRFTVCLPADMFAPGNIYCVSPDISKLLLQDDDDLWVQCLSFVTDAAGVSGDTVKTPPNESHIASLQEKNGRARVFRLFNSFGTGLTPREFVERFSIEFHQLTRPTGDKSKPGNVQARVHRFILFGVLNKLLHRIYEHPCVLVSFHDLGLRHLFPDRNVRVLLDGTRSLDEIAVTAEVPLSALRSAVAEAAVQKLVALPSFRLDSR